jgi:hypothetical protein
MNLFTLSLTGAEGSWIAEKKKNRQNTKTVKGKQCAKEFVPLSNNSMTGMFTDANRLIGNL